MNPTVSLVPAQLPVPVIVAEATRYTRAVPGAAAEKTEEGEDRMLTRLMSALTFRTSTDVAAAPIRVLPQAAARREAQGEVPIRTTSGARPEEVAGLAGRAEPAWLNSTLLLSVHHARFLCRNCTFVVYQ